MHLFDIFLFIVKYTPFWAVPLGLINANFAYLFWLKDFKGLAKICSSITLFCLTFVIVYLLLGGPNQSTKTLTHIFQ